MATVSTELTDSQVRQFFTQLKQLINFNGIPRGYSGGWSAATAANLKQVERLNNPTNIINAVDCTDYIVTNATDVEITCMSSYDVWVKISFRSSGTVSLSVRDSWTFIGGSPSDVAPGDIWELSFKEGICVMVKMGSTI